MSILIGQCWRILGWQSGGGNTDLGCSRGPGALRDAVPGASVGSETCQECHAEIRQANREIHPRTKRR